jgi:HPt (histidine-containing phosphotransfer) domain-containing protein
MSSAKMIDPRSTGLRGLDLKHPVFDASAVTRAEETLKALGGSMQQWLETDVMRLQDLRIAAGQGAWSFTAQETLLSAAHDLKGMGETYGFPLISQLAASLCRLLETDDGKAVVQRAPALACAHVDAIRAAIRDGVRSETHPLGGAALAVLEGQVAKLGVAPI